VIARPSIEFGVSEFACIKEARLVREIKVGIGKLSAWFRRSPSPGMAYSEWQSGRSFLADLQRCRSLLDSTSVITSRREYLAVYRMSRAALAFVRERGRRLGVSVVKHPLVKRIDEYLRVSREMSRDSEYKLRIRFELLAAAERGDYIVFNTLSVRSSDYLKVFHVGSPCWRVAMQRLKRRVVAAAERVGETGSVSYFGVVEAGDESGRLHIHCLWCMSHLPDRCVDPNPAKGGVKRVINGLRDIWPYGHSAPIAVRYADDAYSRIGWNWPAELEEKNGDTIRVAVKSSVGQMSAYMTEYLVKTSKEELWRVRMSRKFGLTRIQEKLSSLKVSTLVAVTGLLNPKLMTGLRLVRRMAKLEAARRIYDQSRSRFSSREMVSQFLGMLGPRESLHDRLKGLVLKTRSSRTNGIQTRAGTLSLTLGVEAVSEAQAFVVALGREFEEREGLVGSVV
jgi:hypothetical protein